MKYTLLILVLFSFTLMAATNIDKKINKTSSKLNSYSRNYQSINKKLKRNAKAILKQKAELKKQIQYLNGLKSQLSKKEINYDENIKQLKTLKKSQSSLKEKQDALEEKLVFVIAKSVSLSVVLEEKYTENEESLIEVEVLKEMLKTSQQKAEKLSKVFIENEKSIALLKKHASSLESSILEIDKKRKELIRRTKQNKKALAKLQTSKNSYKKELKKLLKRQSALKNTLEKLNLVKKDKIQKERERKEREKAFAQESVNLNENLPKVKKHGNSYQRVKTIKYRGQKTIAPLDRYTISKKYGTYTDPIYGIKIFNESISLRPKAPNAKVKNVINGKVIYADNTAVLDNIVIVEHKNGLHTIYANLSQIAPNIKKGKKVRKGAVIGRVKEELVFEVTQKSYHINPIRLFQ